MPTGRSPPSRTKERRDMRRRVATNRVAALSIGILVALVALTTSGVIAATASATEETSSLTSSADTQIVENAPTKPFPGIRYWSANGVYQGASAGWTSNPTLIDDQYSKYVGFGTTREQAYLDRGDGDGEDYYFFGGKKLNWRQFLVDENQAPTSSAQARDPNWSNYKWNTNDIIDEMLDNSTAIQQGKAKMQLFVAVTATSEQNPIPTWVLNDSRGLTWRDRQKMDHMRFDKTSGWQVTSDFLVALVKHYGDDPRIGVITIGEYYTNSDGRRLPADFDYNAFRSNAKNIWSDMITNAPKDASGDRVNIVQTQPITTGKNLVIPTDIANIGIGVSGSAPHIFATDILDPLRRQLRGQVPLAHQVNSNAIGDSITYESTGVPNPWGYQAGATHGQRYEEVVWYYDTGTGRTTIQPLDSMYMKDTASLVTEWQKAYDQFGPNGSLVGQYGQLPNYP
jgi:hypothetical protein